MRTPWPRPRRWAAAPAPPRSSSSTSNRAGARGCGPRPGAWPTATAGAGCWRRALFPPTSRTRGGSDFAAEAALFQASAVPAPGIALGFVYFGHEIPAAGGRGYSRSLPGEDFSLARFTRGLERFGGAPGGPEKPFALVGLSACRGGTPATTSAIFPYADWVLASPTELHLSFLDTRALIPSLAESLRPGDGAPAPRPRLAAAARRMQEESFARLGSNTQAPVALTLYDAEKAAAHLAGVPAPLRAGGDPVARSDRMPATAWRDCGEEPGFGPGGAEAGALVLYRAGRFGRLKAKRTHSGWECPQAGAQSAGARELTGP